MDLSLANKTIMVAASSKGLGFGIAEAVAAEGANVSLTSRTRADIEAAAAKLHQRYGVKAQGYQFDAADGPSIERWIASTLDDFGSIYGLVVNAGGPPPGKFDKFDDTAWQKAFELTLLSAVRMIRGVLPEMRKNKSGSIITVTSSSVKEPIDELLLSNVFRSGVTSLVKSIARDLAPEGIRINNLIPGRIDTERVRSLDELVSKKLGIPVEEHRKNEQQRIPLGRYGTIEEYGAAGAFLLSEKASYIMGSTMIVDGCLTKTVW